jgi:hypothetical protein
MSQPSFTTTELAADQTLVSGLDHTGAPHQVILDATEFNELKRRDVQLSAADEFDKAVEQFFAPLTEAADRAIQASKTVTDPAFFIVVQEGEEGTPSQQEVLHYLGRDTVVLRLIEQGNLDRLIWVGDTIQVLAQPAPVDELALEDVVAGYDGPDA